VWSRPATATSNRQSTRQHALSGQRKSLPSLLMVSRDLTRILRSRYPVDLAAKAYFDRLHALTTAAD
jgi:hypothetical protein